MSKTRSYRDELIPALGRLEKSMREIDAKKSFDRCMVGERWCGTSPISAHAIPKAVLRLISDPSNHVIGTAQFPPMNPIVYQTQPMIATRSINDFSVGNYACHAHDAMFSAIDDRDIDLEEDELLFLIIYRITLRSMYFLLRVGERLVMTTLNPVGDIEKYKLPDQDLASIRDAANTIGEAAAKAFAVKNDLEQIRIASDFSNLDLRATRWATTPSLAAGGMNFHEYPNPVTGETGWSPEWVVILPQDYGQALISATLKGASRIGTDIHQGMSESDRGIQERGNNWRRLMSQRILARAVDIAMSPQFYSTINIGQRKRMEEYMRTRTRNNVNSRKLPNILSL